MKIDRLNRIVVCGAGGFIGGHLIADLRRQGYARAGRGRPLIKRTLGWEPSVSLRKGMEKTFRWIYDELRSGRSKDAVVNVA